MSAIECATKECGRRKVGVAKYCSICLTRETERSAKLGDSKTIAVTPENEKAKLAKAKLSNILDSQLITGALTGALSYWAFSKATQLALPESNPQTALEPSPDSPEEVEVMVSRELSERDLARQLYRSNTIDVDMEIWKSQALNGVSKSELAEAFYKLKQRTKRSKDRRRRAVAERGIEQTEQKVLALEERIAALERPPAAPSALSPTNSAPGQGNAYQILASATEISAGATEDIYISPTVSPYFNAKGITMIGIEPCSPGTNLRFTIESVEVAGVSQLATSNYGHGGNGILSDIFREFTPIDWDTFSTRGLARGLVIRVHNPNATTVKVFTTLFGEAVESLPPW